MPRISELVSAADIMLAVTGLMLLLMGGLIATVYTGVSSLVIGQFQKMTNQSVTDYTTAVAQYVPTILSMLGLVLIIAAVAHIIIVLISVTRAPTEAATAIGR